MLFAGLLSCNSCAKNNNVVPPNVCWDAGCAYDSHHDSPDSSEVADSAPQPKVVSGTGWKLTLPLGWVLKDNVDPSMVVAGFNPDNKTLFMGMTEEYLGPVEGYLLEAVRGIKGAGGKIVSINPVDVNNKKFFLIESKKDSVQVWTWVTLRNNKGFVFTCGGSQEQAELHKADCQSVIDSLELE